MNLRLHSKFSICSVIVAAGILFPAINCAAATIVFSDNFDNATNGDDQAITFASLSPSVGAYSPVSTGAGINDHDDLGEVIGNAAGVSSTNNALLVDTGEDNDGLDGLGVNNTGTVLKGLFTQAFDLTDPRSSFSFSWDWYASRVAGNPNENRRNIRLALNDGNSRAFVIVMELHNSTTIEIAMNDGAGNLDANTILTVDRATTDRSDGSYDPVAFNTSMQLSIDAAGVLSVTATAPDGNTNTVAGIWNNGSNTAPLQLDGFELFVGGTDNGGNQNRGGTFDNFVATIVPEPSTAILGVIGVVVMVGRGGRRSRRID